MSLRVRIIAALLFAASTTSVMAACPAPISGASAAETTRTNSAYLLCLQHELAAEANRRKFEFDLKALERRLQEAQMQQRLALPPVAPILFP